MRIAVFVANFDPGGVFRINSQLVDALRQKGHQVQFISATNRPQVREHDNEGQFSLGASSTIRSLPQMRSVLMRGDYEIVIVSQLFLGLVALVARPWKSITALLLVEHSSLEYWKESPKIKDRLVLLLSKVLLGKADQIAAVSKGTTKSINEQFRSLRRPAVYLPNPVLNGNEPVFKEEEKRVVVRSGIVCAGRLVPGKRVPDIIHAFSQVASEVSDDLTILGDGPEMKTCVNLVNDLGLDNRVFFKGFVENVTEFFQVAKCLVLASESEGLPTVLIEALAHGCEVVSTDCPTGPSEILEKGKFGMLVPIGDRTQLAKCMLEALHSEKRIHGLAKHLDQFQLSVSTSRYESICYEAIAFRLNSNKKRNSMKS
jgi:glycosyltransferase involved in cell wall biosynthesis